MEAETGNQGSPRTNLTRKRTSGRVGPLEPADSKRRRLETASEHGLGSQAPLDKTALLPAAVWHRILSLLPPMTLGSFLAVSKIFHSCLVPSSHVNDDGSQNCRVSRSVLPTLTPEAIWRASRRLHWPHMPAPLEGRSEIDMWRLCCTRSCQFCGTRQRLENGRTQNPWHRGPGAEGVSPVFPLFLVTCGQCLYASTIEEAHLFLSPSMPAFLLAGLPMVLLTPDLHFIPAQLLSTATNPAHSLVVKVFSVEQINAIRTEMEEAKALGHAAAEKWLKGIQARGRRLLADASRWETWSLAGGVHDMRASLQRVPSSTRKAEPASSTRILSAQAFVINPQEHGRNVKQGQKLSTVGLDVVGTRSELGNVGPVPGSRPPGQSGSTMDEAGKLFSLRLAEIERRAAMFKFAPSDLSRVPDFLAMVRVPAPLDDGTWEILKRRLLDIRESDDQRGREGTDFKASQLDSADAIKTEATIPQPAGKLADNEWDEAQGPLRARISGIADEIIQRDWNGGAVVSKERASRLAVEVLLYVRKSFYAEVAKDTAAALAAGREAIKDPPQGPWTQRLTQQLEMDL